jgi:hypothetical protein
VESGRARASDRRRGAKWLSDVIEHESITKAALTSPLRAFYKQYIRIFILTTHTLPYSHTDTLNQQDAPNIQHALVSRAYGVADSEPAPSVVLDEERTFLWQGQHWYVMQPIFARSEFSALRLRL